MIKHRALIWLALIASPATAQTSIGGLPPAQGANTTDLIPCYQLGSPNVLRRCTLAQVQALVPTRTYVGGTPCCGTGAINGVADAPGGVSLALTDNANDSLYVTHAPGGSIIGTDGGQPLRLAARGSTPSFVVMSMLTPSPTTGQTGAALVYNNGATTTLGQVGIGAADSCGAGYRCLRVPN